MNKRIIPHQHTLFFILFTVFFGCKSSTNEVAIDCIQPIETSSKTESDSISCTPYLPETEIYSAASLYFKPGRSYGTTRPTYHAIAETINGEEWHNAYAHRAEYNYYRDTNFRGKQATMLAVIHEMNDSGKATLKWNDLYLANTGFIKETGEAIVDIWYFNQMEAVFVKDSKMDSTLLAGSEYSTYGKNRIYVGSESFDCDGHVSLYFYRTTDNPHHHTQFLCHYANHDDFYIPCESEAEYDNWYSKDFLFWYKNYLYLRTSGGYYRIHLEKIS